MRFLVSFIFVCLSSVAVAETIVVVPGESWGFTFDSPKMVRQQAVASDTDFKYEGSSEIGFVVSGFVESGKGKGFNNETCMNYYWNLASKNPAIQKKSVKVQAGEKFTVMTYLIEAEHEGKLYIQPNANYYGFRDGRCVDFHISQVFPVDININYESLLQFAKTFTYYK